ncbi:MAG: NAD-dependent epimerase/dehydratase family protein [Nitrococcus sp.]|nr:NAD-dependent epimerase/dehydratase family protein [Nitrococcus sp.]
MSVSMERGDEPHSVICVAEKGVALTMKWLITGGCGFIGRALVAQLLAEGEHTVRVLDNLSTGSRTELAEIAAFQDLDADVNPADWSAPLALLEGDITDQKAVARGLAGAEVVIHLAANTGVPQSVADPIRDCHANVIGVLNMLEGCRSAGTRRFVFASSGAPLGAQTPPLHEEMAPRPASPYGASKLSGEGYCSAYYQCFGVETVTLRFGNVYGEGSGHKSSVVAKFIKEALAGQPLEIYGDGSQTRDFIHISDLIDAILRAAETPAIGGEIFQIATASETTVLDLADKLREAMRAEGMTVPEIRHGATRNGDVARNFSDTSKACARLGWSTTVSLEDGLRRTVRFFLDTRLA